MKYLSLVWGVYPVNKPDVRNIEEVFARARDAVLETGAAREGDVVIITAGFPLTFSGSTNFVKVHMV